MKTAIAAEWPVIAVHDLADAILHTLVYADLFDYPLRAKEIHRYLSGHAASLSAVEEVLQQNDRLGEHVGAASPFWFLAGREHLVRLRREREAFSNLLWREAMRYGRMMAAIPFVRMVSITGSLAMNNVSSPDDDIDLLIVAAENRVWLARGMAILIVHFARRFGVELCPNYVVAENRLELAEPSLYTAHEIAQLIPVSGLETYHRILACNAWSASYLPNISPRLARVREPGTVVRLGQQVLEATLSGRLGDAVEARERELKIPRLRQIAKQRGGRGATYAPDLCKGHADDHSAIVYQRFVARLASHGLRT
jgi:hypothetical protein